MLQETVQICGLGDASFFQAIKTIREAYIKFERVFPSGTLEPWQFSTFENFPAIDAANRYFEATQTDDGKEPVAFASGVDPKNILQDIADRDNLKHTDDNRVLFYIMKRVGEDKKCV